MTEEIPEYLRREGEYKGKKNDAEIQMLGRGGRNRYWTRGEERRCRMCCEERRTVEHMRNGRSDMREMEGKERGEILNEDGRG
jgi:hypothetical protein